MKIVITNTVALNSGDSAILQGLICVLRKTFGSDSEFIIYDSQPDVARKYYPELKFRKLLYYSVSDPSHSLVCRYARRFRLLNGAWNRLTRLRIYSAALCWRKGLRISANILLNKRELEDLVSYGSADIIISTGGTYLVENYNLSPRIFDYKISLLMGKPLVFFTQSLGPFSNKHNRTALSKIFNGALLILLRDEKSRENLMNLGVDMRKVYVLPDIAFCLPINEIPKKDTDRTFCQEQSLNVGISVRYWPFFEQVDKTIGMKTYIEVMSSMVTHLRDKYNASITFISTCQGIPEYWTDDSKVALEIWSGLPDNIKKDVRVDRSFHTPCELVEILTSFDIVITTRMHMAILSLIAGTPVLPISYEFKTKQLFKRLELDQWTQDIETLDGETSQRSIDSLLAHFPEINKTVFETVAKERDLAMDSGQRVKEAYGHWLKSAKARSYSKKMRIALILYTFPTLSETFILNQIFDLIDRGHTLDIFALERGDTRKMHPDVKRYNLLDRTYYPKIPANKVWRVLKAVWLVFVNFHKDPLVILRSLNMLKYGREAVSLRLFYNVLSYVGRKPYDIIHCHFGTCGLLGMQMRHMEAIKGKLITTFHGSDMSAYIKEQGNEVYNLLFEGGDLFLPISERWKNRLIELGCDTNKILVHRMGVDCRKLTFSASTLRKGERVRILTVARLVEKKGVENGIRAVAKLSRKYKNVQYDIIGNGPLQDRCSRLIAESRMGDKIHLLGSRDQQQVYDTIENSHIFLCPSVTGNNGDQEGIPVSLMEAMAAGLPVISTRHSGIPELVQDGISGFLVPEKDVDALAERLLYLIEHPEIWPEMGRAGCAHVEANYDIKKLNERLVEIYKKLSNNKCQL